LGRQLILLDRQQIETHEGRENLGLHTEGAQLSEETAALLGLVDANSELLDLLQTSQKCGVFDVE
jgi:hypothetical protein